MLKLFIFFMLSSFLGWLLFLVGIDDIILQSGTIADHTFSLYLYDSNRRGFIIIFAYFFHVIYFFLLLIVCESAKIQKSRFFLKDMGF